MKTQSATAQLDMFATATPPNRQSDARVSPDQRGCIGDTPAQRLQGVTLDNGWTVDARISRNPSATGANFSVPYVVSRNGCTAFLKAMDYTAALRQDDPAVALQSMTDAYVFERDLLNRCRQGRLSRVVQMLDYGTYRAGSQPADVVQYIIFEMADGDIRAMITSSDRFNLAWTLRAMHQATAHKIN